MKMIRNLMVLLFATLGSASVQSESITFALSVAPGGGTDNAITALAPSLERLGYTVKKEFYKSCSDALRSIEKDPNNRYFATETGAIYLSDRSKSATCPALESVKIDFEPITELYSMPALLCTSPSFKGVTTLTDLYNYSKRGKLRIGSSSLLFTKMFEVAIPRGSKLSYVILPYSGGGTLRTAIKAGDVDLYVNGSLPAALEPEGSVCLATTKQTHTRQLPTFDDFLGKKQNLPPADFIVYLAGSTKNIEFNNAIIAAMKSAEFKKFIDVNKVYHNGYGANYSSDSLKARITDIEHTYLR